MQDPGYEFPRRPPFYVVECITPIPPAGHCGRSEGCYAPPALGAGQSTSVSDRRNNERDPATRLLEKGDFPNDGRAPL